MEQFLNAHEYIFKFDIKQSYHHIDILQTTPQISWFFMGGWWGGRGTCCFLYTVFPFWLTSVSFILTKVMKCLIKH